MNTRMMRAALLLWILLAVSQRTPVQAQPLDAPVVVHLRLEGALNPVMQEHLKRALQVASQQSAAALILELDTPGGSIDLMTALMVQMRASATPIVVYVSPRGAMAASAGTILTLAGHASAMAPETTIGAASPVGSQGEEIEQTSATKVKEVLKATVRTLAAARGEAAVTLAQEMIQDARAVSVDEALSAHLIDFKANDVADLLRQADGFQVVVQDQPVTLNLAQAQIEEVPPTFLEELLLILANPNLVFLLLAIGIQAVLIEFSSPGGWVSGFIGVICLLLAAYGMGLLPVNWFGLLFILMAFVLFILDIKAPTHGALTAAGAGSFIVGALVLFNSPNVPNFQRVSVPLVIGTGLVIGLAFFILVAYALRAQRIPVQMGLHTLIGQMGVVTTPLNPIGTVQIGSELWSAYAVNNTTPILPGTHVQVLAVEGLSVRVKPLSSISASP